MFANTYCGICGKLFEDPLVDVSSCGHIFHKDCITTLRKYSALCPICQKDLTRYYYNGVISVKPLHQQDLSSDNNSCQCKPVVDLLVDIGETISRADSEVLTVQLELLHGIFTQLKKLFQ